MRRFGANSIRLGVVGLFVCVEFGQHAEIAARTRAACIETRQLPGGLISVPVGVADRGTYQFLLDTGSGTTVIEPDLARDLRLAPSGRTRLVMTVGASEVDTARTRLVFGTESRLDVDIVIANLDFVRNLRSDVRGVLGYDVLGAFNWQLDSRRARVCAGDPASQPRAGSVRLLMRLVGGRPAVAASFGENGGLDLVLDSAATGLALFGNPAAPPTGSTRVSGLTALLDAPVITASALRIGPFVFPRARAAVLPREDGDAAEDGLLPTSFFGSIYFDNVAGEVVVSASKPGDRYQ